MAFLAWVKCLLKDLPLMQEMPSEIFRDVFFYLKMERMANHPCIRKVLRVP